MNKETWKRVLESFDDQDLIMLSAVSGVKVQGFRQINANNIKGARKLLINEAIKPKKLTAVINVLNKRAEAEENEDEDKRYRSMNLKELSEAVKNGAKLYEILSSLYSSEDEEKHKLASELEEKLAEKPSIEPKAEASAPPQSASNEAELRKIIFDLEKKLKKAEQKNAEQSSKITKLEKNLNDAKEKLKEEKKELNRKLSLSGQELSKVNEQLQRLENESENNLKQLAEKDALLNERNKTISHLNARLLNSGRTGKEMAVEAIDSEQEQTGEFSKKKIALLGNPKNKSIMKNKQYELAIFETSEIEEIFETADWDEFKEIWLLKYKVPATKQAFIQSRLERPVKIVNTFIDLRNLIERGNS
ncbi:hypothetical protein AM500_06145 [Bacillus sp. FJAT-18017]|uniref:hypothetical protein n=1 Tax=Bacillus sp. FJAT-18017 TaxID=1705566 RepID=UPI0006AFCDF0|nr:hypothetical protein [Bacillus sp. FJAT-18017]ALC89410.1 hypothetical protein AM500_06145 [Bacillus sp. FJAT-18017]